MAAMAGPSTAFPVQGQSFGSNGLIFVASNKQLQEAERKTAEQMQNKPVITGLAGHIRKVWEVNRRAKEPIQQQLLDDLRRRKGQYSPEKLAAIRKQGGSEIYMRLTSLKCKTAKAWIKDVLQPAGDKPWGLEATPVPDIPPEVQDSIMQQAIAQVQDEAMQMGIAPDDPQLVGIVQQRMTEMQGWIEQRAKEIVDERAGKMEQKIDDQLAEGGFRKAFDDFIDHLTTFRTAFMKGPVLRRAKSMKWVQERDGWKPKVEDETRPEVYTPSPFDIYPSPDASTIQDGDLIERHRLSRSELAAMKGIEGYSNESIDAVLTEYGRGGLKDWIVGDSERAQLEGRLNRDLEPGETIDALQFWGNVQGRMLIEWGMDETSVPEPLAEYNIEAWLIGRWVVRAYINEDKLGRRPYYSTSFEKIPGSIWGDSLPHAISDAQDMCNGVARALSNNVGLSSGPQVGLNIQRFAEGEKVDEMYPWRQWMFKNHSSGVSEPPIWFFQPEIHADQLQRVIEYFSKNADETSGIPAYSHGDSQVGGAGNTASGLSMLMSSAAKGIKAVISNADIDVLTPMITQFYDYNMEFDDDPNIKGDVKVVARGASALFIKEQQQVRRSEFIQNTNNPTDMQIIGLKGRAELIRGAAKALDLPVDKIVPKDEELMQTMGMGMGGAPQLPGPQALGPDGQPVAGQDSALFKQQKTAR